MTTYQNPSQTTSSDPTPPKVSCGDCLMDSVEVVEMRVTKVVEEDT